jgi:hypothetical protein
MPERTNAVTNETIGDFRRGVMLRYVMRKPNLIVKGLAQV